jgi:hypothetical protein
MSPLPPSLVGEGFDMYGELSPHEEMGLREIRRPGS